MLELGNPPPERFLGPRDLLLASRDVGQALLDFRLSMLQFVALFGDGLFGLGKLGIQSLLSLRRRLLLLCKLRRRCGKLLFAPIAFRLSDPHELHQRILLLLSLLKRDLLTVELLGPFIELLPLGRGLLFPHLSVQGLPLAYIIRPIRQTQLMVRYALLEDDDGGVNRLDCFPGRIELHHGSVSWRFRATLPQRPRNLGRSASVSSRVNPACL